MSSVDSSDENPTAHPPYVAVCGGSLYEENAAELARNVGIALAREGAIVLCGGGGGVMEAVCQGVRSEGGLAIGLLPGDRRDAANPFVDVALPTGLGEMRNMLLVRASDVVIAIDGEFGTLSEIGFALRLDIPVVGLGTWELRKNGRVSEAIVLASSAEEAVDSALALASSSSG